MRSNDLTPPELFTDNNIFSITLHHHYIYSREQKIWLDSFEAFTLSREQKTIVLLGYNGHAISPKEIWDAVGIVDTEYYRQLLVSLFELNILKRAVNKTAAHALAKKRKTAVKNIAQFSVSLPAAVPSQAARADVSDAEAPDDADYARLYVVNIPYDATERTLEEVFEKFGTVVNVTVPVNRETGKSRGFAFIEYEKADEARKALLRSGKIALGGRALYLQKADATSRRSYGKAR